MVSYFLTRGDLMQRVIAAWREDQFLVLSSVETRAELAAVLARPQIKRLAVAPLDDLVVSSDRDLQEMKRYQEVAILNPGQFLLVLELSSMDADDIVERFERDTLIGIQETMPPETSTSERLEDALLLKGHRG
ncbi:MAG: hypothetical protein FJ010_01825 [Chloroflexi bacterium]|nr:hypothetical protein [Chloroflexota bacterium]